MIAFLLAQMLVTNPVAFQWNANTEPDIAGYRFLVDATPNDVGNETRYVGTFTPGTHTVAVVAYNTAGLVSPPSAPLTFSIAIPTDDPCLPPLGAHAPAIFPTSATVTTGRPGSRSFLNYQLGGPDRITEVAIQVDGADVAAGRATGPSDDLKAFSGMWFPQPSVGSHTLGVRVVTAFGCTLMRKTASPLVVKP